MKHRNIRAKNVVIFNENRRRGVERTIGTLSAGLAILFGIIMLIIGYTRAEKCKMYVIDSLTFNNIAIPGNLIKWYRYTGTLFLIFGLWANLTLGACPDHVRHCCGCIGTTISALLDSLFGKMVLFAIYLIIFLCNLLGYFWLHMADMGRTADNSEQQGSINYCSTEIWITAHAVIYSFWIMSGICTLVISGQIFRFFRTQESRMKPVVLGQKKKEKENAKPRKTKAMK